MAQRVIPFIEPVFGLSETDAVTEYMSSGGWLTEFKKTRELEERICDFLGVKYCFMYPNCTLALYAACTAVGVALLNNVIVPDFTMIASATSVEMTGAMVSLADIDMETLCLDIDEIEERIDKLFSHAIMPVALNGRGYDYKRLLDLAKKYSLFVIEDAAQAFGSRFPDGTPIGTIGDVGCFSFSPHKIITMGQGGCAVTNDDKIAKRLKEFRNFGRESSGGYDHNVFGINLKFTDLQAVVGLEQIKGIDWRIARKREIFARYRENLYEYVRFLDTDLTYVVPWYVDIFVEKRNRLQDYLKSFGIGTQRFYPALHMTNVYRRENGFINSELVSDTGLWLPSSLSLSNGDIDYISEKVIDFQKGCV